VEFTLEMAIVMGISAGALALLAFEILKPDVVALVAVIAIIASGVIEPAEALSGFANPAVHTIAAMFVISAGLIRTGVVEGIGRWLIRFGGRSPTFVFVLTLASVVVFSAFINNTPIVVMMIPVALRLGRAHGLAPSKLLIPISYASIFGGCCTLVGTSTNLVVSGMAGEAGFEPLAMFELAPVGLILAAVGIAYVTLVGRRLLPERRAVTSSISGGRIREYVTEFHLPDDSPLAGLRLRDTPFAGAENLRILQVIRGETIHWPPLGGMELQGGDLLIAKGSATEILAAARNGGADRVPAIGPEDADVRESSLTLAEIVIAPGFRFEGATIREIGFRNHFAVKALAVERHGRHRERRQVMDRQLRVGDVVLVQGDAAALARLALEDGIILQEEVDSTVVHRHRAPVALIIAAGVVLGATLTPVPIVALALLGALLMVLAKCLSPRQVYRSIDLSTLVLVAGMIGLGVAAEKTGAAAWAAHQLLHVVRPLGPVGVLAAIYLFTNAVTEVLSNAAAAVLMVPLAISTAQEMGVSERPLLVAVAFAASAAFSSPIGYQTNTIVYGPGGYRFWDYARVGAPLNLLFLLLATLLIPIFWPF
jgi:di/tricarboxylate transporter